MKAMCEPTGRFELLEGRPCRIWKAKTEAGLEFEMYVPLVRAPAADAQEELEAALQEVKAERQLSSFDTRFLF